MPNADKYAFIDESGDDNVLEAGTIASKYYTLVAIVASPGEAEEVKRHCHHVKSKHFPQAKEMKSDLIGDNSNRRRVVLLDLVHPDYALYALLVDKTRLVSEGFRYPKSFVKFLLDKMVTYILRDAENPCIKCDKIKGPAFMEELHAYLHQRHAINLFRSWEFSFVDSQSDICVQAADVIAGSISMASQGGLDSSEGTEIMRILRTQLDRGMFVVFPRDSASSTYLIGTNERTDYNETIERRAVDEAYRFIERFAFSSDFARPAQVEFARALLEHNHLEGSDRWLSTESLRHRYTECFKEPINDQKLRGTIGALRDAGLLVASRSAGGYKLPTSEADLYEFLNNYNSKIDPMMLRIRKARDIVKRATDRQLDILGKREFRNLREAIDATPNWERNRPPFAGEPPGDLD